LNAAATRHAQSLCSSGQFAHEKKLTDGENMWKGHSCALEAVERTLYTAEEKNFRELGLFGKEINQQAPNFKSYGHFTQVIDKMDIASLSVVAFLRVYRSCGRALGSWAWVFAPTARRRSSSSGEAFFFILLLVVFRT